ncbi:MAG TPA: DUF4139 domain-containing protein [Bryobacteraceae bacterium]|nr:DUF4139 domain-containing protein [Bryobacteraceae bacterium]
MRRFVSLWLPACTFLVLAIASAADLPIRTVTLYKNGIGYFERAGELRPGEAAKLEFKAIEMDDVLKSLTVQDNSGGKVASVRYDASETLSQKLSEYPFRLDGQISLAALLDQIRGARLELVYGAEAARGSIVSARLSPAEDKKPEREQVTLMVDSGELRTFDLSAATSIRLSDPSLQQKLKEYLTALDKSRSSDKRDIYIDSSDVKSRQIVAGYMLPTAVWKSSYRLIFGQTGEPMLEGWAIVDNTSGDDWTNVRLALVSGRPVSFISALYAPKYVKRQTVDLPDNQAQGPVLYEGAVGGVIGGVAGAPKAMAAPAPMKKAQRMMEQFGIVSSVAAGAQGTELGELFEYSFSSPVTIHSNESAMLPFLQQKVTARKLIIYRDGSGAYREGSGADQDGSGVNPMDAAEITNSTGKTLDGGPITVFDGNAYSGEALMETLKAADKRLIGYGVDLGTRVTTLFDSSREMVREIHIRRGVLTARLSTQETKTYTIRNVDQKSKTLIIEHPERPGYTLLNQKPMETTANAYRFEVKLAPNATEKFPVSEEHVYDTTTEVTNITPDVLLSYTRNRMLSDTARGQLEQILDKKRQIAEAAEAIDLLQIQVKDASQNEQRIRQNIASLNNVSGQQDQVQRYARQLAVEETKLAGVRDQMSELAKKKSALESELNSRIEKMDF